MPRPRAGVGAAKRGRRSLERVPRAAKSPPFPTKHPLVKNKDGSYSNVLTFTVEMGGMHYVLPSMVGGKKLPGKEAVAIAKKHGLHNYPSYKTGAEALAASKRLHDKQPPPRSEAAKRIMRRYRRGKEPK